MDKGEAKFILSSFRSNGADANDQEFEQALELTLQDQELAEWFVAERAFDQEFTTALSNLDVPIDLKGQITEMLKPADFVNTTDELSVIGALATIQPPPELRSEILHAMQSELPGKSQGAEERARKVIPFWLPLAAAAVVALATYLGSFTADRTEPLQITDLSSELGGVLSNTSFELDHMEQDFAKTVSWASDQQMVVPHTLPKSMSDLSTIGCKRLELAGQPASLICFRSHSHGVLHLVVIRLNKEAGDFAEFPSLGETKKHCYKCQCSGNCVAPWKDENNAYLVVSKESPIEEFKEFF